MNQDFKYDVFLSYSPKDKSVARELAEQLQRDGLHIWFDEWELKDFKPADLERHRDGIIDLGLKDSRTLVLLMSKNASTLEWMTFDRHIAPFRDLSETINRQRSIIPLRLDNTDIKDALKQFAYIDWRRASGEAYAQLLTACMTPKILESKSNKQKSELTDSKSSRRSIISRHIGGAFDVAVTSDGRWAISGSADRKVRVWNLAYGECVAILEGYDSKIIGLAITSDGRRAVSGSDDNKVRVWDLDAGKCLTTLEGHSGAVWAVAVTPDGLRAVSGSQDTMVRAWDIESGECLATFTGHYRNVLRVAVTPDGQRVVSGSEDCTVRVWDIGSTKCLATLEGHSGAVWGVAVTPDGQLAVSGSVDKTVRVWRPELGKCLATLEGHTGEILGVAVTPDGQRAISGSDDCTVRAWDLRSGRCLTTLRGHNGAVWGVTITPDRQRAISISRDATVRMWDLPSESKDPITGNDVVRYTNAKVLLVGDSGVGKSGLALRLTKNRFEPTISTDGASATQMEWATQMSLPQDATSSNSEREIWLWDFAGQADYRMIHQLYMDETALAAFVFNPQNENPFEGLGQWDSDLQKASRRPFKKILVAARCDRGGLIVSRESVDYFRQERGFVNYLETSAKTGVGCSELRNAIINHIPWDDIPWTASPRIFKLLKEEIIKLKDEGKILLRMVELKQQLLIRLAQQYSNENAVQSSWIHSLRQKFTGNIEQSPKTESAESLAFTLEDLRAVVSLLISPGLVWQLDFGNWILLQPEFINSYAAAVIRKVRAHTEEIGCILEQDILEGNLDYQEMQRLPHNKSNNEEEIILRAMHQTFIERGLCLRENSEKGPLLIFPSYFRRERPDLVDHPAAFVTYQFSGMLDEIYATLVIRLHHTTTFEKDQLWRFAADFRTVAGKRVGLKMTKKPEGAAEITVYFDADIPDDTKVTFIRYVHDHLKAKDPKVKRDRHYVCGHCHLPIENRRAVQERLSRGLKDILCVNCENRVLLWDLIEEKFASEETQAKVREMDEQARRAIDNESRELILVGHAFAIAGEAGQIFRPVANSDWGIDGEIEFKDNNGQASGRRVYLQLKSGDSYLESRKDGSNIFRIKKERHAEYWQAHEYPVLLVIRTSDGQIRWMNVTEYLKKQGKVVKQIVFDGEPFTAASVWRMRDKVLG